MKKISLYIHIPFCKKKCLYCDFLSFVGCENIFSEYVSSLINELSEKSYDLQEYEVCTIFFGGGTPTILPSKLLGKIMDLIYLKYNVSDDAEFSIEGNPGTLNKFMLGELKAIGFNRLSIGLQAWQNDLLSKLGRIHTVEEFLINYKSAREVGFSNINVDLMMTLPTQTFLNWEETLEKVIALKPEHISAYSLIIEEGTPFHDFYKTKKFLYTDENIDRQMYSFTKEMLNANGYNQYEISNFAKNGYECRHNEVYWRTQEYIGFGLGSHSYFDGKRFHNTMDMKEYINVKSLESRKKIICEIEYLSLEQQVSEFMFMGLRMTKGIKKTDFMSRFAINIEDVYKNELEYLYFEKLLIEKDAHISLTARGVDISNFVFLKFLK